jgi:hypothetical protein
VWEEAHDLAITIHKYKKGNKRKLRSDLSGQLEVIYTGNALLAKTFMFYHIQRRSGSLFKEVPVNKITLGLVVMVTNA